MVKDGKVVTLVKTSALQGKVKAAEEAKREETAQAKLAAQARAAAEAGAAAVLRDEAAERAAREARAARYSSELDVLLQQKLAAAALADETPLERKLVSSFLKEVKGELSKGKVPLTL